VCGFVDCASLEGNEVDGKISAVQVDLFCLIHWGSNRIHLCLGFHGCEVCIFIMSSKMCHILDTNSAYEKCLLFAYGNHSGLNVISFDEII
jgi:hypothetical protein